MGRETERIAAPRKLWCCLALFCGVLLSCAHTVPHASLGDFSDQVLEPLATRIADEQITQVRAGITHLYQQQEMKIAEGRPGPTSKAFLQSLGLWLDSGLLGLGTVAADALLSFDEHQATKAATVRKARYDELLAWLETRRLPLKQELLALFVKQAVLTDDGFTVCVEGSQRQYQAIDGRFTRLADGPGPCETIELQSLKRDAPE